MVAGARAGVVGKVRRKCPQEEKEACGVRPPAFSSQLMQRHPPKQQARQPGGDDQECSQES